MKTKPYQKLTAFAAAFTLALAGPAFAEEKKDHADHKEHADHKDGDETKKIAGPNGGRVLNGVEPHLEFFVTKDRKVKITAVDDAGKAAPLGEQSVTVRPESPDRLIAGAKLEMVVPDDRVEEIVGIVASKSHTGRSGDGIVFVLDVERAVRVRTGKEDDDAVR